MPRDDDEQDLKAAFAELHGRERADAPPFEGMRERAMSAAGRQSHTGHSVAVRWLLWGTPAACAAALLLWLNGRIAPPTPAGLPPTATAQHVEQLLDSIEQHIEADEAISSPTYATDALLTQIDTDR
jgi:hypothetical protein